MVSLGNFDANQVEPAVAFDPIPAASIWRRSSTRK